MRLSDSPHDRCLRWRQDERSDRIVRKAGGEARGDEGTIKEN